MDTDDHCRRYVGLLQQPAPLRDPLTITGEDDCFGWVWWNVHRDLPSTVVLERLGGNLSRDCARGLVVRSVGFTQLAFVEIVSLLLHRLIFIYRTMVACACHGPPH